jgi:hypothetical protein
VDEKIFDEIVTKELVPGGKDKQVTMENRNEFVKLRIEYEFKVQCASQIASFKKGFDRLVDKPVLKHILTPYDLEQMICGQRSLDFNELKKYCIYANGFHPEHQVIKWFWEIVLGEWSNEQRRALMTFSTGSDRVPVNGLKAMKFYIIKDQENASDQKLPTSHTCFNQLVFPEYSTKDILREKLQHAVDNSTGFGLV